MPRATVEDLVSATPRSIDRVLPPGVEGSSPAPDKPGCYAWWFDALPRVVPTGDCAARGRWKLAYVGIAPRRPSRAGGGSKGSLRKRLRNHIRSRDVSASTLRFTLASLLVDDLSLAFRRVGPTARVRLVDGGEGRLDEWMREHARVGWVERPRPWVLETRAIIGLSLPLNIDMNSAHPFDPVLSAHRREARARACRRPVRKRI